MFIQRGKSRLTSQLDRCMTRRMQHLLGSVLFLLIGCGQASAVDLGIDNDAEYARLISAMRAAEYVRGDVIEADAPKPRVYAVLAGVMAYAERNPSASDGQLEAFLTAFDAAAQGYSSADPDLLDRATFSAALRFGIVEDTTFDGTDTAIGKRALELLGITIPDPDGFESIQRRMVRYEFALARPLDYRNEVFDLLVSGFFGQDPAGNERSTLPSILATYFASEGFDPALGSERTDNPAVAAVNAGLAILPADYAAYTLAIADGPENIALRNQVTVQLGTVRDQIDSIIGTDSTIDDGTLDDALANAPGLAESVDLAINSPAYLQTVIDERRADLRATAQARAASSAATYLMLQSDLADIGAYASYTRDYSQISLETNQSAADMKAGVEIAGSLFIAGAGAYIGDPTAVIGGLASAASGIMDLIVDSDAPPSVEEQTFDQIVELRQQVEEMRQEMNERFDRIDQQLNIMYQTITLGFDALGNQIGDLTADVDSLVREMAGARSSLRRLEAALYGVAQDILLTDLTNETNVVLDYRDENLIDLPYSGGSPDFITASESFFTYATVTALSDAFAGSMANPTVTLDNAEQFLGSGAVSAFLNDLAALPQSLGLTALATSQLPGIEPWSQAAAAYAQLARENPWYFGFRYNGQVADYNRDPQNESLPELDRIMQSGEQLVSLVEVIRSTDVNGNSALFDALVQNYKNAAEDLQMLVDSEISAKIVADWPVFTNGSTTLNFWADRPQYSVEDLIPGADNLFFEGEGSFADLDSISSGVFNKGFNTWAKCGCFEPTDAIPFLQTWYLIQQNEIGPEYRPRYVHENSGQVSDGGRYTVRFYLGTEGEFPPRILRTIRYTLATNIISSPTSSSGWREVTTTNLNDVSANFDQTWVPMGISVTRFNTNSLVTDNLTGEVFITSTSGPYPQFAYRTTITADTEQAIPMMSASEIQPELFNYRLAVSSDLIDELSNSVSSLGVAAQKLDNAKALIDAYVTIGMAKELNQSQVLRSALRAVPGNGELGLGSVDVVALINQIDIADSPSDWADQDFNVTQIDALLNDRIDLLADEIKRGLERPAFAPDYLGWVLAELQHLRDTAFDLAVDDSYTAANGVVVADAGTGLLANDVDQGFRTIIVDTAFEFEPEYVAPTNGTVSVSDDGSFVYRADPGFVGSDSFTYRSTTLIVGQSAFSAPATVVVTAGGTLPEVMFFDGFED